MNRAAIFLIALAACHKPAPAQPPGLEAACRAFFERRQAIEEEQTRKTEAILAELDGRITFCRTDEMNRRSEAEVRKLVALSKDLQESSRELKPEILRTVDTNVHVRWAGKVWIFTFAWEGGKWLLTNAVQGSARWDPAALLRSYPELIVLDEPFPVSRDVSTPAAAARAYADARKEQDVELGRRIFRILEEARASYEGYVSPRLLEEWNAALLEARREAVERGRARVDRIESAGPEGAVWLSDGRRIHLRLRPAGDRWLIDGEE